MLTVPDKLTDYIPPTVLWHVKWASGAKFTVIVLHKS